MAVLFSITPRMTSADFDCPISSTYLGQAHIAGTGPQGTTCRECKLWGKKKFKKDAEGKYVETIEHPKRNSKKHKDRPGQPKDAYCLKPILNKAKRLIPHEASLCRFFEAHEHPMSVLTGKDA